MNLIEKALEVAQNRELEQAAMAATPIANLGCAVLQIAGAKNAKPDYFNPYATVLYQQQAKKLIKPEAAKLFLDLMKTASVPSWAVGYIDINLIKAAAS